MKSKHVIAFDFFFFPCSKMAFSPVQNGRGKKKESSLAPDAVTHHLAHDASVMHLWGTAGGTFKAPLAAAPAVHHFGECYYIIFIFRVIIIRLLVTREGMILWHASCFIYPAGRRAHKTHHPSSLRAENALVLFFTM